MPKTAREIADDVLRELRLLRVVNIDDDSDEEIAEVYSAVEDIIAAGMDEADLFEPPDEGAPV
jgi:hypothetical protein